MAVATGFTFPSDGDTTNATNDIVNNMNILKNSVNNIVADQITDGTVTSAKIASTGIVASKVKGAVTTDAALIDVMENYIDGCFVYRSDGTNIGVSPGSCMINGQLRRITSALTSTYTVPDALDWLDVYAVADTSASTFTIEVVDSGTTPGGSSPAGTNTRLLGSIQYAGSTAKINITQNYRMNEIVGWYYEVGDDTQAIEQTITYGKTFDFIPTISTSIVAEQATGTTVTDLSVINTVLAAVYQSSYRNVTTTNFELRFRSEGGSTFSSSINYFATWRATGSFT